VRDCHVCGEKAGKHSYYGGQVCPSCRAFFRRSVQSGYNATYFCVKDGSCQVTLKTRKNCQFCRYKLCEAAGMRTTWVLTEEERKQKFEGRTKRKSCSDSDELSEEELAAIGGYVTASDYWEQSNDLDTSLLRQIIRMVAFGARLTMEGQEQLLGVMTERTIGFVTSIPEFQQLCRTDREELLRNNLNIVMRMKICSFFNPAFSWVDQLAPLLGAGEVDKLNAKLRSLNVTGLEALRLSYTQLFPLACTPGTEAEQDFFNLLNNVSSWGEDEKEHVLVSLVLLFCPDMLDLVERRKVENAQLKFATLLQRYLRHKHSSSPDTARTRFASSTMLITKCRLLHRMASAAITGDQH